MNAFDTVHDDAEDVAHSELAIKQHPVHNDDRECSFHRSLLLRISICARLLAFVFLRLAVHLPLFDASPHLVDVAPSALSLLRWDAFHFLQIAQNGYQYEYQWAFFPALPALMRGTVALIPQSLRSTPATDLLIGGAMAAIACDTTRTLYLLTMHHFGTPKLALLTSLLSTLPSSPATLYLAPYTEPFFTYLSYRGMLFCAHAQWLPAAILFALASSFRSNGIFLAGFLLWGMLLSPFLQERRIHLSTLSYSVVLTSLVFSPFIYHNVSAYLTFCTHVASYHPQWCSNFLPSIYTHVQATYWGSGFLKYWTLQQVPNFLIAAPPLLLLYTFSTYHLKNALLPRLSAFIQDKPPARVQDPFLNFSLTPHAIHAFFLTSTLLFASHTQIILRVAASMPFLYWGAAWLILDYPSWGSCWVGWSVIWGVLSIILWATFLPPA
ncbi:glycosyltransferase family 76 protein [Crucibulum laeve]|uniref:GPI mannosyltransferase 2 n=1 Tax=Crucibulum laeve TaxID=68775 RepID=A0A5C3MT82_9AGAR|nr:glycosyltransferase family 76 protein [Crucibulum laeve]